MKLRIEVDSQDYLLHLARNGSDVEYSLQGVEDGSGRASIVEVTPGVYSVLLDHRSFTIRVLAKGEELEVWNGRQRRLISVADARDRSSRHKKLTAAGPMELRAQMPGKVIKLLVKVGASVQAGQGLIVVEAMKMQNEMKSPKDGVVSKIQAAEGATVFAGERLLVVE